MMAEEGQTYSPRASAAIAEMQSRRSITAAYHNHKETVIYTGLAFQASMLSWLTSLENQKAITLSIAGAAAVLMPVFIGYQLYLKKGASSRHLRYCMAINEVIVTAKEANTVANNGPYRNLELPEFNETPSAKPHTTWGISDVLLLVTSLSLSLMFAMISYKLF